MRVEFVGDVHGRVLHALAALVTWQLHTGQQFDLILQVGDMGAYPNLADLDPVDPVTHPHLALDSSEADFSRLLRASDQRAEQLHRLRGNLRSPIYFVRGNHEDVGWLRQLLVDATTSTAPVDRFDLFQYVPDGRVLQFGDLRIGFLGGAEPAPGEQSDEATAGAIDQAAYASLLDLGAGHLDVLVTHDAPYGVSRGYHGQIHGSELISSLVAVTEPTFHVGGHLGLNGPHTYGRTTYLGSADLVPSVRWRREVRGFQPGCLGVLDTSTGRLEPVTAAWLADFSTPFDFERWMTTVPPA